MVRILDITERLRADMEQLRDADPEGWPETVAKIAGVVGGMNTWSLDLFCDAATQVAGIAHQMAAEHREELEPDDDGGTSFGSADQN